MTGNQKPQIRKKVKKASWKVEGLDNLIKGKLLSNKKISDESLILLKSAIITTVLKKNLKYKARIKPSKSNSILKQIDVISYLEALQKRLIMFLLIKHPTMLLLYVSSIMLK